MNVGILIRGVYPQNTGGQELHGNELIKHFLEERGKIYLISNTFIPKIIAKNKNFHFYRTPIPNIPKFKFILKILLNFLTLILIHKKNKLNVIHGHGTLAEGLSTIFFSNIFKIKSVITVHGGGVYSFGKRFPRIVSYILKNANQIIVTNDFLKKQVSEFIVSDKNVHIIPNSVLIDRFKPLNKIKILESNFPNLKNKFILLTVARLEKIKNIEFLIELVKSLEKSIPNMKLLIIGKGNLKKYLEKKVQKLGISSKIHFLGEINHIELPIYYNIADVFILLSRMEGQGLAILEAMACGCMVIASKIGGIKNSIENGLNGFLVNFENRREIEKLIKKIQQNQVNINEIKKNARNKILDNFNWDKNFSKILAVYKKST
ncbi:MAG: glycosyltransferase family 4 protein [Candidatus Lokiarchaeota archaeon]|nr:glycosyltransferase family 4 protein [Candidatus Lokiarchaeota archaeon]